MHLPKNFGRIYANTEKAGEPLNRKEDYIAVFDSGVGGISVLRQLRKLMPGERYLYFGDSGNAPYGSRPTAEVRNFAMQAGEHLMEQGIKALVVACNTATAAAIDTLRQAYPNLIIVGIEPALKLAANRFPGGCVGVLATPVTLREEKFQHLVETSSNHCRVIRLPAPGLSDLVEQGKANSPESQALLRPLLTPWIGKMDALVLGCTHYPFASETISKIMGSGTVLLDGGEGTAKETRRRLTEAGLLHDGPGLIRWENSSDSPEITALSLKLLDA